LALLVDHSGGFACAIFIDENERVCARPVLSDGGEACVEEIGRDGH
jgi:hypothetical protein